MRDRVCIASSPSLQQRKDHTASRPWTTLSTASPTARLTARVGDSSAVSQGDRRGLRQGQSARHRVRGADRWVDLAALVEELHDGDGSLVGWLRRAMKAARGRVVAAREEIWTAVAGLDRVCVPGTGLPAVLRPALARTGHRIRVRNLRGPPLMGCGGHAGPGGTPGLRGWYGGSPAPSVRLSSPGGWCGGAGDTRRTGERCAARRGACRRCAGPLPGRQGSRASASWDQCGRVTPATVETATMWGSAPSTPGSWGAAPHGTGLVLHRGGPACGPGCARWGCCEPPWTRSRCGARLAGFHSGGGPDTGDSRRDGSRPGHRCGSPRGRSWGRRAVRAMPAMGRAGLRGVTGRHRQGAVPLPGAVTGMVPRVAARGAGSGTKADDGRAKPVVSAASA
ncbi:hypothetical protein ABH925_006466 [Streptacidiphilus sp. EB129]